jgi:uncharacterized membrane protein YbhN (UPF0104 family)
VNRRAVARTLAGPLLIAVVVWLVEPGRVVSQLARFDPRWLVPIAALSLVQFAVSAWRWRFTARRLGLALTPRAAVADYYLAVFLNQCLPAGVLGDVTRACRHGRASGQPAIAATAVVLERASGQLAFALMALASLPLAPVLVADRHPGTLVAIGGAALLGVGLIGRYVRYRPDGALPRALLAREAWPSQLATSLIVVATYIGIYVLVARGLGVTRPLTVLIPLVPPVLLAMAIPVSVAGWGVREGAAAALWSAAGLPAAEGVAISMAYGAVNLVAALPGLGVLVLGWRHQSPGSGGPSGLSASSARSNNTSGPS